MQVRKHVDSINSILNIKDEDVNYMNQSDIYSLETVRSKPQTKGIEGEVRN